MQLTFPWIHFRRPLLRGIGMGVWLLCGWLGGVSAQQVDQLSEEWAFKYPAKKSAATVDYWDAKVLPDEEGGVWVAQVRRSQPQKFWEVALTRFSPDGDSLFERVLHQHDKAGYNEIKLELFAQGAEGKLTLAYSLFNSMGVGKSIEVRKLNTAGVILGQWTYEGDRYLKTGAAFATQKGGCLLSLSETKSDFSLQNTLYKFDHALLPEWNTSIQDDSPECVAELTTGEIIWGGQKGRIGRMNAQGIPKKTWVAKSGSEATIAQLWPISEKHFGFKTDSGDSILSLMKVKRKKVKLKQLRKTPEGEQVQTLPDGNRLLLSSTGDRVTYGWSLFELTHLNPEHEVTWSERFALKKGGLTTACYADEHGIWVVGSHLASKTLMKGELRQLWVRKFALPK